MSTTYKDIGVTTSGHVAVVEIQRPPHNFFDTALIEQIADAFEAVDKDDNIRAIVLCAQGKSFCAGADFSKRRDGQPSDPGPVKQHLYKEAVRLYRTRKPIIAAVQGPAIGGGLGVACMADFRVTCAEGRFSANFTNLGFHPGFGLTATLPRLVGKQQAALMFYTSKRINGEEAVRIGLADLLVPQDQVRSAAMAMAEDIARAAPLAVMATRQTLRRGFADEVERATERELVEQDWLRKTDDHKEGIRATSERRTANFTGK
jgi:enoyl-CoA hydratase/carnithine racemase